ncbi:MAG: hypothetical protein Q7U42_12150, partial [Parvibaculum sp.]|nr:hypothetical protein [Parvibaculum sp.]
DGEPAGASRRTEAAADAPTVKPPHGRDSLAAKRGFAGFATRNISEDRKIRCRIRHRPDGRAARQRLQ